MLFPIIQIPKRKSRDFSATSDSNLNVAKMQGATN